MDLIRHNLPPDNDRFYTEYNPNQKDKDEIISQIQATDDRLEQNLSGSEKRVIKN